MRNALFFFLASLCPLSSSGQQSTLLRLSLKGLEKDDTLSLQLVDPKNGKATHAREIEVSGGTKQTLLLSIHEAKPIHLQLKGYAGKYDLTASPGCDILVSGRVKKQLHDAVFRRMRLKATPLRPKDEERIIAKKYQAAYSDSHVEGMLLPGTDRPAPAVTVSDTSGIARLLSPSDLGGRYLLVDFWASWCEPCRREMPQLKLLYEQYAPLGLRIIGISIDRSGDDWHEALRQLRLPWPNYLDAEQQALGRYGVQSIPSTFLLDSEGHIVAEKLRGRRLADLIRRLFE